MIFIQKKYFSALGGIVMLKIVLFSLFFCCTTSFAESVYIFNCKCPPDYEGNVWKYKFTVDKKFRKGWVQGTTLGGDPFADTLKLSADNNFLRLEETAKNSINEGYINRKNLTFHWGGCDGKCKISEVSKKNTILDDSTNKF